METTTKHLDVCSIVEEKDCTGCSACMNICVHNAITMVENEIGHIVPAINKYICVDCGLCRKVCPSLNPVSKSYPSTTYALWATDKEEHDTSTSGGVAAVLYKNIVNCGGCVYGCASQPKGIISHIGVDNINDLKLLKESKYVQSDINLIFRDVKKDLNEKQKILFIGMPCQIAGLRSFLHKDYSNLYVVDLICHGVPSQKLLFEYLEANGIKRNSIEKVSFREAEQYMLKVIVGGKVIYRKDDLNDLYLSAFNDSLFVRESCVNCKYATTERTGDLTIGDFRRLGTKTPFEEPNRGSISVALVNTIKGRELLDLCKSSLTIYEREFKEANEGNPHLHVSTHRKGNYKKFKKLYTIHGFVKAAKSTLWMRFLKNEILYILAIIGYGK